MNNHRLIRRIGLISPCAGNLGNAAILSSMIANIRTRIPNAEIIGITLSPEDTSRRHGIAAVPITSSSRSNYSLYSPVNSPEGTRLRRAKPRLFSIVKGWLKHIGPLRRVVRTIRSVHANVTHFGRSARLIRTLDRVIITGGGALDEFWGGPWGHPLTLFKFAIFCRCFRVPLLFVSVGKCSLERPLSRYFVRTALRSARYRSYRDHDSKAAVRALFGYADDPVCPDLAYSYTCPIGSAVPVDHTEENRLIAVSPIGWCDPRCWPVKDEHRYRRYLRELADMVKLLIAQGYRILLFATDSPDIEPIRDLLGLLAEASISIESIEVLDGPPKQTTERLLLAICRAEIVIASRLHGVILSHLMTIPVLAISYDRKVDVHMQEIGQNDYCMDIQSFTADTLVELFHRLATRRDTESAHLKRMVDLNRKQVNAQYDLIFGPELSDPALEGTEDLQTSLVSS